MSYAFQCTFQSHYRRCDFSNMIADYIPTSFVESVETWDDDDGNCQMIVHCDNEYHREWIRYAYLGFIRGVCSHQKQTENPDLYRKPEHRKRYGE